MSTVHRDGKAPAGRVVFTKGAPGMVLECCTHELSGHESRPLTPERRRQIHHEAESLAGKALRTLGVAFLRWSRKAATLNATRPFWG